MEEKIYKIVIWGLGREYNCHINIIKLAEYQKKIEVIAVTANSIPIPNVKKIDGWNVIPYRQLNDIVFDYILICNTKDINEIMKEALELGIERSKLIPVRVLDIPYFDWDRYISLIRSQLSILSCNCWGGILCHTLAMECLSPFKNLSVSARGMLQIVPHLKDYMKEELIFSRWEVDPNSKQKYPVMYCRDVEIHFNHDTNIDEALIKWKRRRKKINFNHILVMIYTDDENIVEDFIQLEGYQKICFVPSEMNKWNRKDIWGMDLLPNQTMLWQSVNDSATGNIALDILKMLSGGQVYRYEK